MKKKTTTIIACFIAAIGLIVGGATIANYTANKYIPSDNYEKDLEKIVKTVNLETGKEIKSAIEYTEEDTFANELPDIETKGVAVEPTTQLFAEIFVSPEKAGTGNDSWMIDLANKFNESGAEVDGVPVSVKIRNVTSGQAMDYIASKKYVPDGFSPSNDMWIKMLDAKGVKTEMIAERTVGNIAGVVIENDMYDNLSKNGDVTFRAVLDAVENGEITMGYTNPFTSSTGLNFLVSTLLEYDSENLLSNTAMDGFTKIQSMIPFVSFNSQQMNNAAKNGTFNAFVSEYQIYINDASMRRNYKFIPYGYRHDNPLAAISSTSDERKEILRLFADYCSSPEAKKLASDCGFNNLESYAPAYDDIDGDTLLEAQVIYKEKKDNGKPVIAVFVTDTSGSMDGEPLNSLKESLINSMKYIGSSNYIGLVSYSSNVVIERPIEKFDINAQAYFKGSVENLSANGSTATYDAVAVAINMLEEKQKEIPNAKLMLFVLSDGETNSGVSLSRITPIVAGYKIPVYTIGYNANLDELKNLSSINEAATINATSDDVVYQLKQLFNANM